MPCIQNNADFTSELNTACQASQPMGWEGGDSVLTAQSELWRASRDVEEEQHRLDHRGKALHGYHEMLAEKMDINKGVTWLAEAREARACPVDFSSPVLPSRDMGGAVGIRCSPSPAQGIWVDGLTARLSAGHSSPFQWEVATQ